MDFLAVGVSHKGGTPVQVREALAARRAPELLEGLRAAGWDEAVVLSTCNRFEIYAAVYGDGGARRLEELCGFLEPLAGPASRKHLYRLSGAEAVSHLLSVTCGLDSLVLGENEILGQVKSAYELALEARMTGKLTNILFQRAVFVGKKVRSQTGISAGQLSVSSVAVALAERIFGSLKERSVLILGAGQMAELSARHLLAAEVAKLAIANRTYEHGIELGAKFRAEAVRWEGFPKLLESVDVVLSSTGAALPVLTKKMLAAAMPARMGRSLFLIDIAMPRDIEDSVEELDNVYLYTLADLQGIVDENMARRQKEISAARKLVDATVVEFVAWMRATAAGEQMTLRHHPGRSVRRGEYPPPPAE